MALLPYFQTEDQTVNLMQTKWKSVLDPLLKYTPNSGVILTNVVLAIGINVINHLLGVVPTGWIIIDQNAAASIYRSAPLTNLTLTLTSDAVVTLSLEVF